MRIIEYCINSKVPSHDRRPTIMRQKHGKIYLVSTPSETAAHDFIQYYVNPAKAAGNLRVYTIFDNPHLDQEDIDELIAEYEGGMENPEFMREYLCKIVQSSDSIVVPEFTDEKANELIQEWEKPAYFDAYVAGDIGFKDLTVY